MSRFGVSAIYVAANMLASLVIVVWIVRAGSLAQSAQFFVFQAVFFPIHSVLSQYRMQRMFRSGGRAMGGFMLDVVAFAVAFGLLRLIGGGFVPLVDILLYALAVPLSYRGATNLAALQFNRAGSGGTGVPLVTAAARLAATYVLLDQGAAIAFLGAALMFALVPSIAARRLLPPQKPMPHQGPSSWREAACLFGFFAISGFTFQWDRYLLAQVDLHRLIVMSGVCMTWILSPVSTLFAVIYRAEAPAIFGRDATPFDPAGYVRRSLLFCGMAVVYAGVVVLAWEPVNELLFPAVTLPVFLPLMLMAAVVLDRLGLLALFMSHASGTYAAAIGVKLAVAIAAVTVCGFGPWDLSLALLYTAYGLSAAIFAGAMWGLRT